MTGSLSLFLSRAFMLIDVIILLSWHLRHIFSQCLGLSGRCNVTFHTSSWQIFLLLPDDCSKQADQWAQLTVIEQLIQLDGANDDHAASHQQTHQLIAWEVLAAWYKWPASYAGTAKRGTDISSGITSRISPWCYRSSERLSRIVIWVIFQRWKEATSTWEASSISSESKVHQLIHERVNCWCFHPLT